MNNNNYKLEYSFLHKEELTKLFLDEYSKNKMTIFGFFGSIYFETALFDDMFEKSDWGQISKVIIVNDKIIGVIIAQNNRFHNKTSLSIYLFDKSKRRSFFRALTEFVHEIFNEYFFIKAEFRCISFNKTALKLYENLVKGNHLDKVGIKKNDFKVGEKYYDTHLYEISKGQFDILERERRIK